MKEKIIKKLPLFNNIRLIRGKKLSFAGSDRHQSKNNPHIYFYYFSFIIILIIIDKCSEETRFKIISMFKHLPKGLATSIYVYM